MKGRRERMREIGGDMMVRRRILGGKEGKETRRRAGTTRKRVEMWRYDTKCDSHFKGNHAQQQQTATVARA